MQRNATTNGLVLQGNVSSMLLIFAGQHVIYPKIATGTKITAYLRVAVLHYE
jgi:hypothetical protein